MTYEETMRWIDQAGKSGIILGLDRMQNLLDRLDHPERSLKMIHVAGTNGKGSVCTFIAAILEAAGYSVGRYISPTLFEYRERIQVSGEYIEEEALAEGMSRIRRICEEMADEGLEVPTVFEIETAMGFLYFKQKKCDYVVLETGMGGRLDSTNVIESPVLTVLAKIAMDHMMQLGDTLEKIAGEKAGIIKNGAPAVSAVQDLAAKQVLVKKADQEQTRLDFVDGSQICVRERKLFENSKSTHCCQRFDYKSYADLQIHIGGTYQVANACLAIEAVEHLNLPIDLSKAIREGLEKAVWPGRFECLSKEPPIFIDGAHNPNGAESLKETIETYFPEKTCHLIMGVFADKDYTSILKIMSEVSDTLITFTPENSRGLESDRLKAAAEPYFSHTYDGKTAEGALKIGKSLCRRDDVLIIFGSLSIISTICDII